MKIFNLTKSKTPKEEVTCIFKLQSEKQLVCMKLHVTCNHPWHPPLNTKYGQLLNSRLILDETSASGDNGTSLFCP